MADLTWMCLRNTTRRRKLIFLVILHYKNHRIRTAFSKYFLLCFKQKSLIPVSDCQSELWFKRYSHFKFWANIFTLGRKLYENPTIYMQYGYDGFKISINIKVNHSLKSYQLIDKEINWWEKCFGVRFVTLVLRERIKIKINSKPRFENELELPLARSCLRPAQRFPYQLTIDRPAGQVEIRPEPHFLGHELDRSFYLSPS